MKNSKLIKIALLVLSLTLVIGAAIGFSVSADTTEGAGSETNEPTIIAQNIVYGEKVSIAYAVDVALEDADSVRVAYYWEGDEQNVKYATLLDTSLEENTYVKDGTAYPVFVTEGVPAKELGKVAYATVYTGASVPENAVWFDYSAVEYLYVRLYVYDFVSKTEADGKDYNKKLLYENLLDYAENAQIVFDYNTDKLVGDYEIAYTENSLVTLNGGRYAFGYDLTVDAAYTGDGNIEKWTVTGLDGVALDADSATIAVDGVAKIDVVLGVHECADEDNDHVCDTCGEISSECVNENNTEDHLCDICGKVVDECTEGDIVDGLCDVCKSMNFEFSVTTGVHLATGSAVLQDSFVKGETYTPATKSGVWGNIVNVTKKFEGGREEISNVLKITLNDGSAKNTSVNTLGGIGSVYFAPAKVSDNGGNIHILEFDFNWAQASKKGWRNPFTLFAYDASGNYIGNVVDANGSNNQYCVWSINNGGAFSEGTVVENAYQIGISGTQTEVAGGKFRLFDSDTWYRIRYIWDESTGEVYISASDDNGETWYQACTMQTKKAMADAAYVAFGFEQLYGAGGYVYFDNINYNIVSELPELPADNGL